MKLDAGKKGFIVIEASLVDIMAVIGLMMLIAKVENVAWIRVLSVLLYIGNFFLCRLGYRFVRNETYEASLTYFVALGVIQIFLFLVCIIVPFGCL